MAFIDLCNIYIKAGDGGDGIVSWRRETHVPLGGPAGGNGGNGGSIYFIGNHNETSLEHLRYQKKFVAQAGEKGGIKGMHGANAEDVYINVPLGTVIYDNATGETLADIKHHEQTFLIAHGGKGGHGNAHFKSGFNKAPTLYELGEKGDEFFLKLELKQIADIGLVGFPNAGKSTLISKMTNAKPKIGNYQFTTLIPILGTIDYEDQKIILADIPGLISGANEGVGLGHEFLKHIERCKILVHLISLDELDHERTITDSYVAIINELKKYNKELLNKKIILVANKLDAVNALENLENFKKQLKTNENVFAISALNNKNLKELKELLIKEYSLLNVDNNHEKEILIWKNNDLIDKEKTLDRTIDIVKINEHLYEIKGDYLKYWSHRIPLNTADNIIRFNQKLANVNLEEKLKNLGANKGDTIRIYGVDINYED